MVDAIVASWFLPNESRRVMLGRVAERIHYRQARNATAKASHTKAKLARYALLGIAPDKITKCKWPKT